MSKIKLTKNELKKQKDDLKRFTRYLPTLELKKKQLLQEIRTIQNKIEKLRTEIDRFNDEVNHWVHVFAEETEIQDLVKIKEIITQHGNIAGIDIPVLEETVFEDIEYDLFSTPLWLDKGIAACKEQIIRKIDLQISQKQEAIIREELRITIQRIKLFEEVKIPNARESIRVIQIFLGDQMTAEVVRGKIAKAKIERKKQEAKHA